MGNSFHQFGPYFLGALAVSSAALLTYLAIPFKIEYNASSATSLSTKFKAVIYGATGAVGAAVTQQLIDDPQCEQVTIIARRVPSSHSKVRFIQISDFDADLLSNAENQAKIATETSGNDVLFYCLGSTYKKAGSAEAFEKIDKLYTLTAAKIAKKAQIRNFYLVSSTGASKNSFFLYPRVKGQTEAELEQLHFANLMIARPALLITERAESRFGEQVAQIAAPYMDALLFGKLHRYQSIPVETVARAMIKDFKFHAAEGSSEEKRVAILENDVLHHVAKL